MTEAAGEVEDRAEDHWTKTWNALDFDDERVTIEGARTVEALNHAVTTRMPSKKRSLMEAKVKEILETKDFPSVQDPAYTGYHLPDPLTLAGVEGLMDSARRNQVLHPVYAIRLIAGAAHIIRDQEKVMNEIKAPEGGQVIVVGDTHGQLTDLLTIFKLVGLPSEKRVFVFNGDFVDRGPHDVSLLLILLAWKVLMPHSVYLNRGNHEQRRMNERYSFERHCRETYKSCIVYELVQQLFLTLPMSTLINEKVLVLHGGLFPFDDVTLDELRALPRGDIPAEENGRQSRLLKDMLWSDPRLEAGWAESTRGAGILWGPDLSEKFVKKNHLELVIRSHEMVNEGYLYWHDSHVVTLFSASNYCGVNENRGAVAIFDHTGHAEVRKAIGKPFFQQYYAEVFLEAVHGTPATSNTDIIRSDCQQETLQKLRERIFQKRHALSVEFSRLDTNNSGLISEHDWAHVMHEVFDLPIDWYALRPYLATIESNEREKGEESEAKTEASADDEHHGPECIQYMKFLDRYKVKVDKKFWATWEQSVIEKVCAKLMEHSSSLKKAFQAMDTNGNNIIEYDEFVQVLSQFDIGLSKEQIFDFMRSIDVNRDGHVDYQEFAETFSSQWKSAVDVSKNQEHIQWLKAQMQLVAQALGKKKSVLRAHFKKFDKNGDGGLTYDEFTAALDSNLGLHYTSEESVQLARLIDSNDSGRISWKEFKRTFAPVTKAQTQSLLASVLNSVSDAIHRSKTALRTLFYQMDLDGSGRIDVEELRTGLEALNVLLSNPLTDDQLKALHHHIDKDQDGYISYDEFLDSFSVVDTTIETEAPKKDEHVRKSDKKDKPEKHHSHHDTSSGDEHSHRHHDDATPATKLDKPHHADSPHHHLKHADSPKHRLQHTDSPHHHLKHADSPHEHLHHTDSPHHNLPKSDSPAHHKTANPSSS